jgi:hypothetical protein
MKMKNDFQFISPHPFWWQADLHNKDAVWKYKDNYLSKNHGFDEKKSLDEYW